MAEALKKLIVGRCNGRDLPVTLVLPDGERVPLSDRHELDIVARNWNGLKALALPTMGSLARHYVHGDLDFTGAARRVVRVISDLVGEVSHGRDPLTTRFHLWLNQRHDNRDNIRFHYDVSDAFYRLWLDRRLVYSCGYFRRDDDSLEAAQRQKLDHICRKLRLAPGEKFLDIGCGWGALLFHAAERYGVDATGITLSRNQYDHALAEIAARRLEGRVRVELRDYLDLPDDPAYDKIASVGMFEHVGVGRLPEYFGRIQRLLKPGGLALNHGITHNPTHADSLGSGIGAFVDEYVFPGGELTHVAKVIETMAEQGLELLDAEALRPHYAKTLWHWCERLEANGDAARAEVSEETYRVWRIYLAGSAHAFERGWLSLWQLLAGKPRADGSLPHPLTREYMYA